MTPRRSDGYALEALLELRGRIRQQRQQQLAAALSARQQQAERLGEVRQALALAGDAFRAQRGAAAQDTASVGAGRLLARRRFFERLEQDLDRRQREVTEVASALDTAEMALAAARQALARAEAELEVVQRDRERWDHRRRQQELRRAEAELDELCAARHGRG